MSAIKIAQTERAWNTTSQNSTKIKGRTFKTEDYE